MLRLVTRCPPARFLSRYSRNDQIYLHEAGGQIRPSFCSNPAAVAIGSSPTANVTPETFKVSQDFVSLLHDTIASSVHNDFTFIMEAGANASAFMPVYDFREIPRYARTPNVDDIFGYVMVDDAGKIVQGLYQPNEMYRVCNGVGLTKLSDHLLEAVREACGKNV